MTETQTLTLTEFLLARIAEDESAVMPPFDKDRDDCLGVKRARGDFDAQYLGGCLLCGLGPCAKKADRRVLAECEAKRRIVELDPEHPDHILADHILRALALPYAEHPDYRYEWAV